VRATGLRATDLGASGLLVSRTDPVVRPLGRTGHVIAGREPLRVRGLAPRAWLVQARRDEKRLGARALDDETWLVRRRRQPRRQVRRIGPDTSGAHLVFDHAALQSDIRMFEQGLSTVVSAEHVAWMLRELDVNCVLDVGANTGQYARGLRRAGYTGRIVSFEPLAPLVEELRAHAADDPDWSVVPHALGEADAETEINFVPGTMSSMLPSSEFGKQWSPVLAEMRKEPITIRRLDGLWDSVTEGLERPRVYLKMDTQGYDLQTFAGAGERISQVVGMQSEVACVPIYDGMPRMVEQLTTYEDAGFSLTGMFPVTIDPASLRVIEFDAVMIRVDARAERPV
jgi:FkbM family methyltransferase